MCAQRNFEHAIDLMQKGDFHSLRVLLVQDPKLVLVRDSSNAKLFHKLFQLPDSTPNIARLARVLLLAGADVNEQQSQQHHVPLVNALRSKRLEVIQTLLEFGANFRAKAQPMHETALDYAIELCQANNSDEPFTKQLTHLIYAYTGGKLK